MRYRILAILPVLVFFDYGSYQEKQETFFSEITKNYENQEGPGMGVFYEKIRFKMSMADFPITISERGKKSLDYYGRLTMRAPEFVNAYGYELKLNRKDAKFSLVFQSVLIPYLQKEFKKGKEIELYCSYGLFDTFSQEHTLFINEFHIQQDEKPKAKGPVVKARLFAFGDFEASHNLKADFPPALLTIFEHKTGLYSLKYDTIFSVFTAQGLARTCDTKLQCSYRYGDENIIIFIESDGHLKVVEGPKDGGENIMNAGQVFKQIPQTDAVQKLWLTEPEKKTDFPSATNKGIGFDKPDSPVPVVKPGKVEKIQPSRGPFGGLVIVEHDNCFKTVYFPLEQIQVKEGETVEQGRVIGKTGKTKTWPRIDGLFYLVFKNACGRTPFDKISERINPEKKWGK